MNENLVGYVLESLDPESRREVDDYLAQHPEAQAHLELLRKALEPLAADTDPIEPPSGLWVRTLSRIAEHSCRPLPAAPMNGFSRSESGGRSRWRRADVLVAAGLLLCVGLLIPPGLSLVRDRQDRINCEDNLRRLHGALVDYGENHNGDLPMVRDGNTVAETLMPLLRKASNREDGALPCPANQRLRGALQAYGPAGCYSYSLGFRDDNGLHGLRLGDDGNLPILGDRPFIRTNVPFGQLRDNSPNHGGQNILHVDGHVSFSKQLTAGVNGDDIFHNRNGEVAAGLDHADTVLGTNNDQP